MSSEEEKLRIVLIRSSRRGLYGVFIGDRKIGEIKINKRKYEFFSNGFPLQSWHLEKIIIFMNEKNEKLIQEESKRATF